MTKLSRDYFLEWAERVELSYHPKIDRAWWESDRFANMTLVMLAPGRWYWQGREFPTHITYTKFQ